MTRHPAARFALAATLTALAAARASAQAPTLPASAGDFGSMTSSLGPSPGAGASPFGTAPGEGLGVLGGRPGPSVPRIPFAITAPGRMSRGTIAAIAPPPRAPAPRLPVYGTLALPDSAEDDGPPDGLTLDDAVSALIRDNLALRAKAFEIPQARADVLTAGLRANPFIYADSQLVPYGRYTSGRPGGATQYDVNITHPFDLSGKRRARTEVAEKALSVLEAQFQDSARLEVDALYVAFVDALAARETVRYAEASVDGLGRVIAASEALFARSNANLADVARARGLRESAELGLLDARESALRSTRALATLLNIPPDRADALRVRGRLAALDAQPPPAEDLARLALASRPDLAAGRLGVARADAYVRLARANRYPDVYVLLQPFTYQDNSPFGLKSPTSYAVGLTAPLPVYDRNQGNILRSRLNVCQTRNELAALEQRVVAEAVSALREYRTSTEVALRIGRDLIPEAGRLRDSSLALFSSGEITAAANFLAQREYNDAVRRYRDALVRHRRAALALNTAVGLRVLP